MNATREYADFVARVKYTDIPETAISQAKRCILDWAGAVAIGSQTPVGKIVIDLVKELGSRGRSTLVSEREKVSCTDAALANGAMSHTLEVDDYSRTAIMHVGVSVIPAALALAEREGVSGKEVITAIIMGYETAIRVSHSVIPSHYQYWHVTGTAGTFGAAIASGKILGLDKEGMVNTLGSAGTQAAGLMEFTVEAAMSKSLHPGKAAQNGVLSALLAQKGFTGASTILEGERGFFKATSEDPKPKIMLEDLGKKFEILNISFKPHAACGHCISAIDAVLDLVKKHEFKPGDIDRIRIKTYTAAARMAPAEVKTGFGAKFHLPYCVSVSIVDHEAGVPQFTNERIQDSEIRTLMKRCKVEVDPELDKGPWLGGGPSIVEIYLEDGTIHRSRVDYGRGNPQNPLSDVELQEKYKVLASGVFGQDRANTLIERVNMLEKIEDVGELTALLRP